MRSADDDWLQSGGVREHRNKTRQQHGLKMRPRLGDSFDMASFLKIRNLIGGGGETCSPAQTERYVTCLAPRQTNNPAYLRQCSTSVTREFRRKTWFPIQIGIGSNKYRERKLSGNQGYLIGWLPSLSGATFLFLLTLVVVVRSR